MASTHLCIVVLHWNRRDETIACLDSVRPQLADGDVVVLVDNGSDDGSLADVRAAHPWVRVIEAGSNLGFAAGNNLGLRWALEQGFPWVMLLNDDTVVPDGALRSLLRVAGSDPTIGAVQPLLVRASDPARIDSAGHALGAWCAMRDALAGRELAAAGERTREVFGACAAASLMRADALAAAGLLDEDLFVLFEDTDLSFRLRLAGYRAVLAPSIRVAHHRGVSAKRRARRRRFWAQRNSLTLAIRYWPTWRLLAAAPVLALRGAAAIGNALLLRDEPCVSLWTRALAQRRSYRAMMRRRGVDAWIGDGAAAR